MVWFYERLKQGVREIEDAFSQYRISEALMIAYKLFWDEFSSWYLEIIKPEYQKSIDHRTYQTTIEMFEVLLKNPSSLYSFYHRGNLASAEGKTPGIQHHV